MMKSPVYLNALRAFEASARHQSFSAAAAELHVTPAAVGQLVRSLEDWLGVPLFERASRGRARLLVTEAGQRALPDIRAGLERLALGLERLRESAASPLLSVTVSPAFAAKWLLPRLDRFQQLCPDTDVRLETSLKAVDFVAQRVDIGVRYGNGCWDGLQADKLLEEEIFPVCSPRLLQQGSSLATVQELAQQTLIHDLSVASHASFPSWDSWLQQAGVVPLGSTRGLQINNSAAVLQAAIEGQGIALARSVMAHDELACGRLLRLFPEIRCVSPLAYYVVYRSENAQQPRLSAFRRWLLQEAGGGA